MKRNATFLLFVAASILFMVIVVASLTWLFWQQLPSDDQAILIRMAGENLGYLFSAAVLLLAGLGFGLDWLVRIYILPLDKLAEETRLIHSVNPSHRIHIEGGRDVVRLAQIINEAAERYEELSSQTRKKIELALLEAEEEKNILAAIMSELPEGVMICNTEARILLYNNQAKRFLTSSTPDEATAANGASTESGHYIGLGRSIFGLIDKHLIVHALDEIAEKLKKEESAVASYFVIPGVENRLLRVEAVPILNQRKDFNGFILILDDITQQLKEDHNLDGMFRSMRRGTRSSLASIRSAIETIIEYPGMDAAKLRHLKEIILGESINLGELIDRTSMEYSKFLRSRWPLVPIQAGDLLAATVKKAAQGSKVAIEPIYHDREAWIRADTYSITCAMLFIQDQIAKSCGCSSLTCVLGRQGKFVHFDLIWPGKPIKLETLNRWGNVKIHIGDELLPLTLKEVIGHHKAEMWSYACDDGRQAYLRVLIPALEMQEAPRLRHLTILPRSRPEFFDFDIFSQPGQTPELDNRPLSELAYTVFDTETTGLDPMAGDEIISIGAVRIVNNRILREEHFDQLVDPGRPVPPESTQIHGITNEMVKGQPGIEVALARFRQFAEDTILVAHNAAFDMRMFQLKESSTAIRFDHPVLDTLLLSAIVHPGQDDHNMEGIAERMGVSIFGRHTALGDAIATAEIFLKLLELLEKQGITTLKQARIASRKTYYARLKY